MKKIIPHTDIYTIMGYEEICDPKQKPFFRLAIKLSVWFPEIINSIIFYWIKKFEPREMIGFSSCWNMVCQTADIKEYADQCNTDLIKTNLINNTIQNKIPVARDSILYFIVFVILANIDGKNSITGKSNVKNSKKFYKSLLLINSRLNNLKANPEHDFLKDIIIREYPYHYIPNTTNFIFRKRIIRYWYIYTTLLKNLDLLTIERSVKKFEEEIGISLNDYYYSVWQLYFWFLDIPRRKDKIIALNNKGFLPHNPDTFYIRRKNFQDHRLMNCIEYLSKDIMELRKIFGNKKRKYSVDNSFYRHFQTVFDNPVFCIDDDNYCIIDLKFLIDGICGGLQWRLQALIQDKRNEIKSEYGFLLENYFIFLVQQMFSGIKITNNEEDSPDAVLETKSHILLFEFTTEYYRFVSLYNSSSSLLKDDLYKILLCRKDDVQKARGKKVEGKLLRLNHYIEKYKNTNKKIIPVLVTENYLGDFDMLNKFDDILNKGIIQLKLQNLQKNKPLFICLDDLEIAWALFKRGGMANNLIQRIEQWNKSDDKGAYHFNFGYFLSRNSSGKIKNGKFRKFFSQINFLKAVKPL